MLDYAGIFSLAAIIAWLLSQQNRSSKGDLGRILYIGGLVLTVVFAMGMTLFLIIWATAH